MRIAGAAIAAFRLPFRKALPARGGAIAVREGFLLRLTAADGTEGYGEAGAAWWVGGESPAETRGALARVAGRAAGMSDEELASFAAALSPAARCAVDTALLDLLARLDGTTVAERLGGADATLEVAALLAGESPEELFAEGAARAAAGHLSLKLKVGRRPLAAERERVAAVLGGARAGVRLRLDANRGWNAEEASRALAMLAPFAVEYVEEPLDSSEPRVLARLRREGVPIALDESIASPADLRRFLDAGAMDAVVVKAARLGGLTAALVLARAAHAAGLGVTVTDSIESAVGRAAALHLAAALPVPRAALGLGGGMLLESDVVAGEAAQAARAAPRGPGLGVRPVTELWNG